MTTPDTSTVPELTDAEVLARVGAVLMSIVQTGRADMRALRSLPSWQAVQLARVAFKAGAVTRAELDAVSREAAVLGGVKPVKPPRPGVTLLADTIVTRLAELWNVPPSEIAATRADRVVTQMIKRELGKE